MKDQLFAEAEIVGFLSANPIPYGNRIASLGEPIMEDGEIVVKALLSSGVQERIYPVEAYWNGDSFIVLRHWKGENDRFAHEAVSFDSFVGTVNVVENSILDILRS